jgi:predicted Zn-dependent protease
MHARFFGRMLALWCGVRTAWAADAPAVEVEALLVEELGHAWAALSGLSAPEDRPHHLALEVRDIEGVDLRAQDGAFASSAHDRARLLDVDLRAGTPERDSSHPLRGVSSLDDDARVATPLPWDGPGAASGSRVAVARAIDDAWRGARERLGLLRGNDTVLVSEDHPAPDFEPRAPMVDRAPPPPLELDEEQWRAVLASASERLLARPEIVAGQARLQASRETVVYVDSEGTRLVHGGLHARVSLFASAVADDGDEVDAFVAFDVHDPRTLPDVDALLEAADRVAAQAAALRVAPRAEPYTGPVMLSGRAAGVFFHEVMGHRVEGHRQKSDEEGQTFWGQLGKPVLPSFVSVVDDPTRPRWGDVDLNGAYRYDDEGVAAQPASLVERGVFRGFLMGRSPLVGFPHSNGHGRRSAGHAAQARMGNTLVTSDQMLSEEALRALLRKEMVAQGQPFAYFVEEIDGGFTLTGREIPNSFNVKASLTWRVWADGRPDELVRGIDMVGTPLAAFQNLMATGGQVEVFNGVCGAESGWVPVSAVAPAMVFRRMEFQLKDKSSDRPPLRERPSVTPSRPAPAPGGGAS